MSTTANPDMETYMANDRPAGMDSMKMNFPRPTQKTPPLKNEMSAVRKAAGGRIDGGGPKRPTRNTHKS